ncbi:MAG: rhomboid family intramembrane serine protease [Planctomycetota bacterium]
MLLFPYSADVPIYRWPIANFCLIGVLVLAFLVETQLPEQDLEAFILQGWNPTGILGHMWLHVSLVHLVGNCIFLWVFGNAVSAKIGNGRFILAYLGFGLVGALTHLASDGRPAVGASGAINGIVGLYLTLYPTNQISCFFFILFRFGTFSVSGFWMILVWFAFDVVGAIRGGGSAAYQAHLGGFAAGCALGYLMLRKGLVEMSPTEKSILDVLGRKPKERPSGARTEAVAPTRTAAPQSPRRVPLDSRPVDQPWVTVRCECGRLWRIPAKHAGKRFRCASCSALLEVREAERP